jgi:hypothetical protein
MTNAQPPKIILPIARAGTGDNNPAPVTATVPPAKVHAILFVSISDTIISLHIN